jgi:dienelactone hydrolase
MYAMKCSFLVLFGLSCSQSNREADFEQSPRAEAMQTFAGLLRIPVEAPQAAETLHGRNEEEDLIIEDISWDSLDGVRPLAYVIRPKGAEGPLPAIVCLHGTGGSRDSMVTKEFGHGEWTRFGRDTPHQQSLGWARELARHGYLVLAMTQRGLDNRTPDTDSQNKVMLLRGRNVMGAIVYEIRQAVTILQTRPDVNPHRIGMTGMSFGGITTFYTWLVDERIAAAAPICGGVGSLDVYAEIGSLGYHGIYWWIPDILTKGDQGDFAAAMAPRPLMLWAPLDDIGMPKEGVDRFMEAAEPAYESTGLRENLVVHRPPGEHRFTLEAFNAMKAFFDEHLMHR